MSWMLLPVVTNPRVMLRRANNRLTTLVVRKKSLTGVNVLTILRQTSTYYVHWRTLLVQPSKTQCWMVLSVVTNPRTILRRATLRSE